MGLHNTLNGSTKYMAHPIIDGATIRRQLSPILTFVVGKRN